MRTCGTVGYGDTGTGYIPQNGNNPTCTDGYINNITCSSTTYIITSTGPRPRTITKIEKIVSTSAQSEESDSVDIEDALRSLVPLVFMKDISFIIHIYNVLDFHLNIVSIRGPPAMVRFIS